MSIVIKHLAALKAPLLAIDCHSLLLAAIGIQQRREKREVVRGESGINRWR